MAQPDTSESNLTADQWTAIKDITETVYVYRTEE